ncbi:MAG: hypothetical protein CME33_04265 [Gimesia sp.]|nr:hypothetical protein [Gimesia sp.]
MDLIVMRFQILPFTQRKGYLMGMAYCPVFDNEEVDNSFNEFNYFPLELDTLDRLASEIKVIPLSEFVHHDPDSSPSLYFVIEDGIETVDYLIKRIADCKDEDFESFTKEEIQEELVLLKETLESYSDLDTRFAITLIY